MSVGPLEIAIVVVIILLLFGAKRLPEMGKGLGKGMREFKDGIVGEHDDEKETPELTESSIPPPPPVERRETETADRRE